MRNKSPSFYGGISFRLAVIGIVLAFVVSFVMSSFQVYIDYKAQSRQLDILIDQVVEVATPPAARAVHTLDEELALEVASGLLSYDSIDNVAIRDERGDTLAQVKRQTPIAHTNNWLSRVIAGESFVHTSPLRVEEFEQIGSLVFSVDKGQALASFYERSEVSLLVGAVRNLILVLFLFIAFYFILTKPLVRLSQEINAIDPDRPGVNRLTPLESHRGDELGTVISSVNQLLDVVELSLAKRRAIELALRKSEEHLRQIVDSLPVLIGARNLDGYYLFANRMLANTLGYSAEQMHQMPVKQLLNRSTQDVDALLHNDRRVICDGEEIDLEEEGFIAADGSQRFLQTHMMPLDYYDEKVCLIVSVDVTERKKAQAKMEHMAHHDALTGLANRLQLVKRLEHEATRARRHGYYGAVLFIDLDKFKNINDSLGHPVGDRVLQQVAARLQSAVRREDLVARLSGDEFVVVSWRAFARERSARKYASLSAPRFTARKWSCGYLAAWESQSIPIKITVCTSCFAMPIPRCIR